MLKFLGCNWSTMHAWLEVLHPCMSTVAPIFRRSTANFDWEEHKNSDSLDSSWLGCMADPRNNQNCYQPVQSTVVAHFSWTGKPSSPQHRLAQSTYHRDRARSPPAESHCTLKWQMRERIDSEIKVLRWKSSATVWHNCVVGRCFSCLQMLPIWKSLKAPPPKKDLSTTFLCWSISFCCRGRTYQKFVLLFK